MSTYTAQVMELLEGTKAELAVKQQEVDTARAEVSLSCSPIACVLRSCR